MEAWKWLEPRLSESREFFKYCTNLETGDQVWALRRSPFSSAKAMSEGIVRTEKVSVAAQVVVLLSALDLHYLNLRFGFGIFRVNPWAARFLTHTVSGSSITQSRPIIASRTSKHEGRSL